MAMLAAGPATVTATAIDACLDRLEGEAQDSLLYNSLLLDRSSNATPYGVKASIGTRPNMEDAYSVQLGTPCPAPAPAGPPGDDHEQNHGLDSSPGMDSIHVPMLPEDLAVLSVFDGHGGTEVAEHCKDRLHRHFATQLSLARFNAAKTSSSSALDHESCNRRTTQSPLSPSLSDSPLTLSALRNSCALPPYHPDQVSEALASAFQKTDQELAGTEAGEFVGATAVVAIVGKSHIWVAHCGDSRAVIQRAGEAEALTRDHKPDREDEVARIKAAGGRIVFNSGSHRVMGMLAMSRAIGDHFLRPYVIAEPEVKCVERSARDEVLVLATDGLWDVFSCKEATNLALRCIMRSKERGMSRHGACRVAASVLTKVALERGSRDNITVIVVDITIGHEGEGEGAGKSSSGVAQSRSTSSGGPSTPAAGARNHGQSSLSRPSYGGSGSSGGGTASSSAAASSGGGGGGTAAGGHASQREGRSGMPKTQSFSVGTYFWLKSSEVAAAIEQQQQPPLMEQLSLPENPQQQSPCESPTSRTFERHNSAPSVDSPNHPSAVDPATAEVSTLSADDDEPGADHSGSSNSSSSPAAHDGSSGAAAVPGRLVPRQAAPTPILRALLKEQHHLQQQQQQQQEEASSGQLGRSAEPSLARQSERSEEGDGEQEQQQAAEQQQQQQQQPDHGQAAAAAAGSENPQPQDPGPSVMPPAAAKVAAAGAG